MKVFIYYQPPKGHDVYEGTRLRKTLKGACELADVTWVDNFLALPDIVHFLSPDDENKANDAHGDGYKVVFSLGYSENDPNARFFDYPSNGKPSLKAKSLRALSKADLILVPNDAVASSLNENKLTAPVKVLPPCVNLSRFEFANTAERNVFKRYYGVRDEEKYVMSCGDYGDHELIEKLKSIALGCPSVKFFFFGTKKHGAFSPFLLNHYKRHAPKNLLFNPIAEDDVYRSAMLNASAYLLLDEAHPDCTTLYDAFAAKTQVVAYGDQRFNPILKNKENCYIAASPGKAAKLIESLSKGEVKSTIMAGYLIAKQNALPNLAKKLKAVYTSLLEDQKKEDIIP
ncbi:MAG: Processive diacylglycerol alpha-glucosyltransferase [Tenericutes bacterium ADurb.BinA155]|jgi:1,2-diacylglycerol-3-alpha-glucose alpha-1,2-glucosyltransferase|nr:MAG: Processive diacylglycerol alpha-glucosyltransferase [Tenericutes bacterium ADurb.BinA155]